ncbi:hypothetical protein F511_14865 [Dorcoceras hygrometricum]|uniref:Uncharacterized protein n=1 Tax=Dorcoceras hygrometricum TaxID=472368 RepID=A0A2Z7CJ70_9LAMI|nr:hypothetical protein F511_14865 [Dorcoceras hygrometricum]
MGSNPSTESNYKSAVNGKNKMQMLCMRYWTTMMTPTEKGSQGRSMHSSTESATTVATGCVPSVVASHSPGHNTRIPDASKNSPCGCPTYELWIHCSYCQQLDVQSQDQHNAKRYPLLIPAATSKCGVAPLTSAKPAGVFSQNQPPAESPSAIKTTTHPLHAKGKLTRVDNQQAQLYKSVDACKHTQSKLSTDSRNGIASTNPNNAAQDTQSYIPTAGHPVATSKQRTQYPLLVIQSQPQNAALQLTQTTSLQTRRKNLAKYQTHATMLNQQDTISNQSQATGTLTRVDSHRPKPAGTPTTLVPQTTLKSVLYRNTLMQRLDTKTR